MSRVVVKLMRPSAEIRTVVRAKHEKDATHMMAAVQEGATNDQLVVTANNSCRK